MILAATVTFWVLNFDHFPAYGGNRYPTKEACREYAIILFETTWPAVPKWWECKEVLPAFDPVSRKQEIIMHELGYPHRYLCGPNGDQVCTKDP